MVPVWKVEGVTCFQVMEQLLKGLEKNCMSSTWEQFLQEPDVFAEIVTKIHLSV